MSLDLRIELWMRWLFGQIVQWSLIGWNWLTESWDACCEYCIRMVQHLEHANKRDVWILINQNELPYCVKEGQRTIPVQPYTLFYYPDTYTFTLNDRLQEQRIQRFDVVSVVLQRENQQQMDISSFFHSVQWKPNGEPSLYEVVLLFWLHQHHPVHHRRLSNCSLIVLDSNAEEHVIALGSPIARRRFAGWV